LDPAAADAVAPSKEELAAYWRKVAKRALPFLARRPRRNAHAQHLAGTNAERYVTSASLARRPGGCSLIICATAAARRRVGAYSPRVREGFPIAAPVNWKQVERGIRSDSSTVSHPFRRANVSTH